jgi:hypothetical protein
LQAYDFVPNEFWGAEIFFDRKNSYHARLLKLLLNCAHALIVRKRREVWRVCARLTRILLTIRDRDDFTRKTVFPFVKRVRFEMKSDALKSMISQS